MAQLYTKVKLYLEDNSKTWEEENSNIQLMTRKGIQFINRWEVSDLSEPTDAQLNALESEATTLESNNQVDSTRRTAYGSWNAQLDEIYHDIDAWKARLQTIKTNNPKS